MAYKLPKGHLSHSQVSQFERCGCQYEIFTIGGARTPPDFVLETKLATHRIILEDDLAEKITTGHNKSNVELSESYRAGFEKKAGELKEDPNLEGPLQKAIEVECAYFDKLLGVSEPWRKSVKPLSVEESFKVDIGGIPVEGRIDLIMDEEIWDRIVDLKRVGKQPSKTPERSRQLVTYAMAKDINSVGIAALVENVRPMFTPVVGEVTDGLKERVTRQYQAAAEQISLAAEKGIFAPVDVGDQQKAWVCTAQYCGSWRIGSKDWITGRDISCRYGERSTAQVGSSGKTRA